MSSNIIAEAVSASRSDAHDQLRPQIWGAAPRQEEPPMPPLEATGVPQIGLWLKRLVLLIGGTYLAMVCVTNLVNVVEALTHTQASFLNSGNTGYISSITKVYSFPSWSTDAAVFAAATIEGIGVVLFGRALLRYRGNGIGLVEVYQALAWNIAIWFAFIVGTEFFVAYQAEGPFRELLGLGLLMIMVVAVLPDTVGQRDTA
jgi:hypothetical protein